MAELYLVCHCFLPIQTVGLAKPSCIYVITLPLKGEMEAGDVVGVEMVRN